MSHQTPVQTDITRRSLLFGRNLVPAGAKLAISDTCLSVRGISCRACEDACLQGAIRFEARPGGRHQPAVRPQLCTSCGDCLDCCPVDAVSLERSVSS